MSASDEIRWLDRVDPWPPLTDPASQYLTRNGDRYEVVVRHDDGHRIGVVLRRHGECEESG